MRIDAKLYDRMPAHLQVLFRKLPNPGSDEVLAGFPNVDGATSRTDTVSRGMFHGGDAGTVYPDSGSAARFFYQTKPERGTRPGGFGDVGADSGSSIPNGPMYQDRGSAARFFYTAKASRDDRNIGCDGMPEQMPSNAIDRATQREGKEGAAGRGNLSGPQANHHPTVKPTDLMQYLVRLVTPLGGTVLDPFAGSGSTGLAADREGFDAILIEREAEYVEIARRRIVGDCPLFAELAA